LISLPSLAILRPMPASPETGDLSLQVEMVAGAGVLLATGRLPRVPFHDDVAAVKEAVAAVYSTFYTELDKRKYRTLLTEDYLLLESAILRRGTSGWRLALLHSTRTTQPAG